MKCTFVDQSSYDVAEREEIETEGTGIIRSLDQDPRNFGGRCTA
jgi:hypothetical protein